MMRVLSLGLFLSTVALSGCTLIADIDRTKIDAETDDGPSGPTDDGGTETEEPTDTDLPTDTDMPTETDMMEAGTPEAGVEPEAGADGGPSMEAGTDEPTMEAGSEPAEAGTDPAPDASLGDSGSTEPDAASDAG